MNITRLNFAEILSFIKNIIKQSHYVSFDLQMSGITQHQNQKSIVDSIQQRYHINKTKIQKFIPLQLGVCCYKIDSLQNKVRFYPFNFYIYPLSLQTTSKKFQFQSSSLNFLTKNNFDFNKLFYEYIPYISKQQLKLIEERKQQKQIKKQLMQLSLIDSPATTAFLNIQFPIVRKWITQGSEGQLKLDIEHVKYKVYKTLIDKIEKSFPSNSFQFYYNDPKYHLRKWLFIKKTTLNNSELSFEQPLNQLPLINEVIDCIVDNKLPVIVHNGLLDLMHIQLRFIQKLPLTWQQFCHNLHSVFPTIYDTKFICSTYPTIWQTLQRMTSLQHCYQKLKNDFENKNELQKKDLYKFQIADGFKEYTLTENMNHEAGFDAMITGYVFFRAMNILKKPLESLKNANNHNRPSLMRNRIPLGLRVPLNLQESVDYYIKDGNSVFQITSLLNTVNSEESIISYLKTEEGVVNFYWKDNQKRQFFIMFIDKKDEQNFSSKNLDQYGIGLLQFLNDKYLVRKLKREILTNNNYSQPSNNTPANSIV